MTGKKGQTKFRKSNFKINQFSMNHIYVMMTFDVFTTFFLQTWGNGGLNRGPEAQNPKQRENPSRDGAQVNPVHQLTLEAIVLQNLNQSPGAFSVFFCYHVGLARFFAIKWVDEILKSTFRRTRLCADMTFCHLSSLRGAGGCDMGQGTFATNGSDPARVKAVLKSQKASGCKCKRQ